MANRPPRQGCPRAKSKGRFGPNGSHRALGEMAAICRAAKAGDDLKLPLRIATADGGSGKATGRRPTRSGGDPKVMTFRYGPASDYP